MGRDIRREREPRFRGSETAIREGGIYRMLREKRGGGGRRLPRAAIRCAAVLAVSTLVATSCMHAPTYTPVRDRAQRVAELVEEISSIQAGIETLKGVGRITFEQKNRSNSSSFTLRYRAPDRLRIDLFGPLGLPTLIVAMAGEEASVALPQLKYKWTVDLLQTSIPMAKEMAWTVVRDALLGGTHMPPPELFGETELVESGDTYVMRWSEGAHQYEATIDKRSRTLEKLEVFDVEGRLEQRYRYRSYREMDGVMRPSVIALDVPRDDASVVVSYDSLRINLELKDEDVTLPEGLEEQSLPPEFEGPGLGEEFFEGEGVWEPE
jgi:outer membrane lipoprotein-sorting protein